MDVAAAKEIGAALATNLGRDRTWHRHRSDRFKSNGSHGAQPRSDGHDPNQHDFGHCLRRIHRHFQLGYCLVGQVRLVDSIIQKGGRTWVQSQTNWGSVVGF